MAEIALAAQIAAAAASIGKGVYDTYKAKKAEHKIEDAQGQQKQLLDAEADRVKLAEDGQKANRAQGGRNGLLAYVDDANLNKTLG
jgi:hypothetical protein